MADDKEEFSGKTEDAHVYGAADDSNRQPPPEQGMRGEQSSTGTRANLTHEDGTVTVQESSGTAFAEAAGRVGPAADADTADNDAG